MSWLQAYDPRTRKWEKFYVNVGLNPAFYIRAARPNEVRLPAGDQTQLWQFSIAGLPKLYVRSEDLQVFGFIGPENHMSLQQPMESTLKVPRRRVPTVARTSSHYAQA